MSCEYSLESFIHLIYQFVIVSSEFEFFDFFIFITTILSKTFYKSLYHKSNSRSASNNKTNRIPLLILKNDHSKHHPLLSTHSKRSLDRVLEGHTGTQVGRKYQIPHFTIKLLANQRVLMCLISLPDCLRKKPMT